MINLLRPRPEWDVDGLLRKYAGLRLVPSASELLIEGTFDCYAIGAGGRVLDESYQIRLIVPDNYPRSLPRVYELAGRIPASFHTNPEPDGSLCLGAPTAIRLAIQNDTLAEFVEKAVVPYLYGYYCFLLDGTMPFDELPHGVEGIISDLLPRFKLPPSADVAEALRLAGLPKRQANKQLCPCRSGIRLGRCHHKPLNELRRRLGRSWWREEHRAFSRQARGR